MTNPVPGRGARFAGVKRDHLGAILRVVDARGAISRSDLGLVTGLSRSTVGVLVADLAARGLVVEGAPEARGGPGRPSPTVSASPDGPVVIAAELGIDGVTVAVVALGGTVTARERVEWTRGSREPGQVASEIAALASVLLGSLTPRPDVIGAGVAVPGLARTTDGSVALAPNLGWHEVPFGQLLRDLLPARTAVAVGNEADLGALAEFVRGAGAGTQHLLYVSGEVGVGGGFICRGQLLGGRNGFAGEVGHLPVNPAGTPCRCGSVGCWETEAGEEALLRRAGRRRGADLPGALEALLRDAKEGDRRVLAALDEHGRWVGIGLAGLVNVLNPDRVVLGGLFARMHPFIAERVAWEMERRCLAAAGTGVEVVPAGLGVDSALIGAAELAFESLLADPTSYQRGDGGSRRQGAGSEPGRDNRTEIGGT